MNRLDMQYRGYGDAEPYAADAQGPPLWKSSNNAFLARQGVVLTDLQSLLDCQ
jgi:hypothetical protein